MKLTFLSLWSINAPLELDALCGQLLELKRLGLEGVVFHPRFYPGQPAYLSDDYMEILSALIGYAREIGMAFWIYDENGWPSGTAGGEVLEKHPEARIRILHEDLSVEEIPGVSPIEAGMAESFIELTHERYAARLTPEAFAYISGFFTDEAAFCGHGYSLSHGAVPWCADMPERFRTAALFTDAPGGEAIRVEYWEYVTDLLQQRFYQPIRAWCERHGKAYTGHLKGEEHPYFQVSYSGSVSSSLRGFTLPGVDALERHIESCYYPRLAASVALQFGDGHAMCEAMGGGGWGVSPRDEEEYLCHLAGLGIDTFILHLCQYRLDGSSLRDWPPSRPCHLPWKEAYPTMLQRVRRRMAAHEPARAADVLVVTPARGAMAGFLPREARCMNEHDGDNSPDVPAAREALDVVALCGVLHRAGITYDLTDERTLEREGSGSPGALRLGRRVYPRVVVASGCRGVGWTRETPPQSPWRVTGYDGERQTPAAIRGREDGQYLCDGPFHPDDSPIEPGGLIASGCGFCPSVTLRKTLETRAPFAGRLMLTGVAAAAAQVWVDGALTGYAYAPDWSVPAALEAGSHVVEARLYNSGYNVYGPHHYYRGDAPLCSPLHYEGRKHFGDPADAPDCTAVRQWHFVPYRLFGHVHLLDEAIGGRFHDGND